MRQKPVRKQQRLRVLHVRRAGHGNAEIAVWPGRQSRARASQCAPRISRAASFTYMRNSVATISLRLRPVCSFAPSGPSFSISAVSAKWWTSSAFELSSHAASDVRARFDFIERHDELLAFFVRENSRSGDGARPGAIERELLRQQPAIELPGALELVEGGVGGALERPPHIFWPSDAVIALRPRAER